MDYITRKCELLEEAFKKNNLIYAKTSDEYRIRYLVIRDEPNALSREIVLDATGLRSEMSRLYKCLCGRMEDVREYVETEYPNDHTPIADADLENHLYELIAVAREFSRANYDEHDIDNGDPWSEVTKFFDDGWNYLG